MLSTLARFPWSADKRPLTQRGFKDAGYNPDHSRWPVLVQTPCRTCGTC
jgi:hypothetical protein